MANYRWQQIPPLVYTTPHNGHRLPRGPFTQPHHLYCRPGHHLIFIHAYRDAPICQLMRHAHHPHPPTARQQPVPCHYWVANRMVHCKRTAVRAPPAVIAAAAVWWVAFLCHSPAIAVPCPIPITMVSYSNIIMGSNKIPYPQRWPHRWPRGI